MAKFKFMLYSSNKRKDGSYPVCLRVAKRNKIKYINLGMSAMDYQWNDEGQRFKKDKRINPDHEKLNSLLNIYDERVGGILREFAECRIDWTLNQFEEKFVGQARRGKVCDYVRKQIVLLDSTNHYGCARIFGMLLSMLHKYDKKAEERLFGEIDYAYVCKLNAAMEKDGLCGNTRRNQLRTLRTAINKAIKDKEAPSAIYPFGKEGFSTESLAETTPKRYLLKEDLDLLKNSIASTKRLEIARRTFLFSYYCFGMSYVDMANLTTNNLITLATGEYIVYKRQKTKTHRNTREIAIPMTPVIRELLEWFKENTPLVRNFLLPIVRRDYTGKELYDHISARYSTFRQRYKHLGEELGIKRNLTTYVSRHTMAMTLQSNSVPREVISQTMGHTNMKTTNVYLDSFATTVIDSAAMVL